jgi:hypothetical protein
MKKNGKDGHSKKRPPHWAACMQRSVADGQVISPSSHQNFTLKFAYSMRPAPAT